ncbi:DUF5690 family protein [Phenylobacterium sp.]|uniref:DUF5690 family protein n=1 Tax=Phenylobacterium sp. TaxID=1871053 RepID=UPI0025F08178|nr:DUF5690 family protein [Phenylobacterium sp.]
MSLAAEAIVSPMARLRDWLSRAPAPVFTLYGGLMAFGAYFAMYAFRKPFTVAGFAGVVPVFVKYKIALVIAQLLGYAISKIAGVKVISEMPPQWRAIAILALIAAAELSLVLFALIPAPWNIACLFANGLALGMIWGLVFGFLEGRRLSEPLGAMLCVSFIVSSGVVKSVGAGVMLRGWANEYWMPAVTGLLFAPLLLICVFGLAALPPPNAEDQRLRVVRAPMNGAARVRMFAAFAPGLIALVAIYVGLTALRDFRDNFAVEIWNGLGFKDDAEIFTLSELPVAGIVLASLSVVMFVRDNRRAFLANLALVAVGLATAGLCSLAFQQHLIGPVAWMISLGAGLYLAYTPFNALLFDRFIAAGGQAGTAGFLIYVADASGYVSSVALLVFRDVIGVKLSWVQFLLNISYGAAVTGLILIVGAALYFDRRLGRANSGAQPSRP